MKNNVEEPLIPKEVKIYSKNMMAIKSTTRVRSIIIALVVFLLIAGMVSFFLKLLNNQQFYKSDDTGIEQQITNSYVDLRPIIVQLLSSGDNKRHHLKLTLAMRVNSDSEAQTVKEFTPLITDAVEIFVIGLRANDFNSTGNVLLIKEELTKRINSITYPVIVKEVLFKEILLT